MGRCPLTLRHWRGEGLSGASGVIQYFDLAISGAVSVRIRLFGDLTNNNSSMSSR